MPTVQPVTTLNVDNVAFNVADQSAQVKALVTVYDEWNQDLATAQKTSAQLQAALNELSRQIIVQLKTDQDAAAKAAADAAAAPAANDATAAPAPASVN